MRILMGFPLGEAAESWRGLLGGFSGAEVVSVHGAELFLARLKEAAEVVIVHAGMFYDRYPWEWMEEVRRVQPVSRVIVVLDEAVYDSFGLEAVCRLSVSLDFETVPVGGREEDAAAVVASLAGERPGAASGSRVRGGKIVAVWSAASKDGATTVAINTALALASEGRLEVGLIDGNLRNPEIRPHLNLVDRGHSHFKLRPKLQTQTLQTADLLDACTTYRKMPGLHILTGSPRRDTALDVTPDMMSGLLQAARSAFDITIVDLNAYPDNAATVCTVREADVRWLVTQNNYASYQTSWNEWYNCYWKYCGLAPDEVSVIVNRAGEGDKPERISDLLGMPLAGAVPNVAYGLGLQSVHEGMPLFLRPKAEAFTEVMGRLAGSLLPEELRLPEHAAPVPQLHRKARWAARFTALFG